RHSAESAPQQELQEFFLQSGGGPRQLGPRQFPDLPAPDNPAGVSFTSGPGGCCKPARAAAGGLPRGGERKARLPGPCANAPVGPTRAARRLLRGKATQPLTRKSGLVRPCVGPSSRSRLSAGPGRLPPINLPPRNLSPSPRSHLPSPRQVALFLSTTQGL